MKNLFIFGTIVAVISVGVVLFLLQKQGNGNGQTACTMEAKLCPDGSAVGRTGPNCEFAECKTVDGTNDDAYPDITAHQDLIVIDTPLPNQSITSPLTITGKARGMWFFEASFPIVLVDWDGKIIAQGHADAIEDWMTEDFVHFKTTLVYKTPFYGDHGTLILQKDNPSGLPQNDDAVEIPVQFVVPVEPGGGTGAGAGDSGDGTGGTNQIACTQEAKLCPDGSYVARTGPNCEFAACPTQGILPYDSGIKGIVLAGPTCPGPARIDVECPDKPIETVVTISHVDSSAIFVTTTSDAGGEFVADIPPGEYVVRAEGGQPFPYCKNDERVTVESGMHTLVTISCDTGIR
jgi:hypothetical protein